jgi:hypothetical protein
MPLTVGINSYIDLEEANSYFADRIDVVEWTSATDVQKEQALATSAMLLNYLQWQGTVENEHQHLAFPRAGEYFDPLLGRVVEIGLPDRIKKAQAELAHHLLINDGLLDDTGGVSTLEVDTIKLVDITKPAMLPYTVKLFIAPLQQNKALTWWRAW